MSSKFILACLMLLAATPALAQGGPMMPPEKLNRSKEPGAATYWLENERGEKRPISLKPENVGTYAPPEGETLTAVPPPPPPKAAPRMVQFYKSGARTEDGDLVPCDSREPFLSDGTQDPPEGCFSLGVNEDGTPKRSAASLRKKERMMRDRVLDELIEERKAKPVRR